MVQWKGYPARHEWTWEPVDNLTYSPEAIADFHRKHPAAPRSIQLDHLAFLPGNHQLVQPTRQTSHWMEGKVQPDAWNPIQLVIANSSTETPISNHLESVRQASPSSNRSWHQTSNGDWNVEVTDDGWGPIEQNPAWDEPKTSAPPPRKPLSAYSKPEDPGHALMHWSFCRTHNCPYHRGECSWYG